MLNTTLKYSKKIIISLFVINLVACSGGSTGDSSTTSGVLFGNGAGLMYLNNTLLPGSAQVIAIDSKQISGVVIDSANNMYASTLTGKVYQYIPSSTSWIDIPGNGAGGSLDGTPLNLPSINVLALNNNKLYAATGFGNVFVYTNNHWNYVGNSIGTSIQALVFDQDNNIYAGGSNAVVYEYSGNQWVALAGNTPVESTTDTQVNALAIDKGILYAGTGNSNENIRGEVYRYDTIDATWNRVSSFDDGAISTLASNNGVLYAGTNDNNATGRVYESQAGSWAPLPDLDNTAIDVLNISNSILYAGTNGNNGQVYSYDPVESKWDQISSLNNGQVTALTIEDTHLYAGTINPNLNVVVGTLYSYESSASSWSAVGGTTALDGSSIFSTTIDANGNYYAGTQNNVFEYSPVLQLWLQQGNLPDSSGVSSLITYNGLIYAGTFAGNIFYQVANISNWTQLGGQIQNSSITSFAVKSDGTLYASITNSDENVGNVLQYNVSLESWVVISGAGENGSLDNSQVLSLTVDKSNNLYAGTQGPNNSGQVWEYPESRTIWILVGSGSPDSSSVQSVITNSNGHVYAGTQAGNVFKYTGAWEQLGGDALDGSAISAVTFSNGILYATTNGGNVWYYTPSTNIWTNAFYGPGIGIGFNNSIVGSGI